jgi:hypothetical protein
MSSSPNVNSIVFNLAGGAVLVVVAGYMVVSYFTTPVVPACTARYAAGQQFILHDSSGSALTSVQLQGRTGAREWGLLKNAKVVVSNSRESLEVKLASTEDEDHPAQNGVGFVWPMRELSHASAACLSYGAYLPAGFAFKEVGVLPGLYGAADMTQIDELQPEDAFAMRMSWYSAGDIGVDVRIPGHNGYWEGATRKKTWPTGRWVSIQQEVILNTPGKADGTLRVWIDGALTVNRSGLALRGSQRSGFSGVVADIGYARTLSDIATLRLSPFIVQWQ